MTPAEKKADERYERAHRIASAMREHKSLVKVGKMYGITDERVRQIIKTIGSDIKGMKTLAAINIVESMGSEAGLSKRLDKNQSHRLQYSLGFGAQDLYARSRSETCLRLYREGKSRYEICDITGLCYRTVGLYLLKTGNRSLVKGEERKQRDANVAAKRAEGFTLKELSVIFEMTQTNIAYCINRHNYGTITKPKALVK